MEFWGVEIKAGETVKCEPGDDKYLHLSQASLGEVKKEKGNERIPIHLKFDNQQLVIGTLSADKCPQITYDLVFEKEFELSHGWKNGSVFFVGYKTEIPDDGPDDFLEDTDSESDKDALVKKEANGKPKFNDGLAKRIIETLKARSLAAKSSVKEENKEDEDDDSGEDELDEDDDEDMLDGEDDSSDEDNDDNESSEEEDDDSPEKAEIGKKRSAESALKTPASGKKAKLVVPGSRQKTDGKKGGHTATPHPAKQAGKTPATNDKSKQQTPKSAGSVSCKSCSKTFKDDNALQAHTKAKHSGK